MTDRPAGGDADVPGADGDAPASDGTTDGDAPASAADAPTDDAVPVPPAVRAGEWEPVESSTAEYDGRLVSVTARQRLFGDRSLRDRVRAATGFDRHLRTFFAGKLVTSPALSARIADTVVKRLAVPRARERFVEDLESRGFEDLTRGETSRLSLGDREARLTRYEGRVRVRVDGGDARGAARDAGATPVPVAALLAVWHRETYMLTAGGVYPLAPVAGVGADGDAERYRSALVESIRGVDAAATD